MKLQIIETENYILAVSDEEIKKGQELIPNEWYVNSYMEYDKPFKNLNLDNNGYLKRVLAYRPKGNAPKLDLPLLPEMVVEDDVEKLAKEHKEFLLNSGKDLSHSIQGMFSFIDGYNSSTKVYSEDDLRKAYNKGFSEGVITGTCSMVYKHEPFDEYSKSLKQPKIPKWFVAEMEVCDNCINHQGQHLSPDCCHNYKLKTTTINDKEYLIGKYLYE